LYLRWGKFRHYEFRHTGLLCRYDFEIICGWHDVYTASVILSNENTRRYVYLSKSWLKYLLHTVAALNYILMAVGLVFMIIASIFFWFFVVLFCFGSFFMEGFFSRLHEQLMHSAGFCGLIWHPKYSVSVLATFSSLPYSVSAKIFGLNFSLEKSIRWQQPFF